MAVRVGMGTDTRILGYLELARRQEGYYGYPDGGALLRAQNVNHLTGAESVTKSVSASVGAKLGGGGRVQEARKTIYGFVFGISRFQYLAV